MIKEIGAITKRERGERVKQLRESLGLSRKMLCDKYKDKYGLSFGTLQSWEDSRWGGLTEKGAGKLNQAIREEGIEDLTIDWLMEGIGLSPLSYSRLKINKPNTAIEIEKIKHELQVFHKLHENAVDMMVADNGMFPYLNPGDIVAGIKYLGNEIIKAAGSHSIIQTLDGTVLIRLLEHGDTSNLYNLICVNPTTTVAQQVIENVQIFSAAPIIWIRKQNIIS